MTLEEFHKEYRKDLAEFLKMYQEGTGMEAYFFPPTLSKDEWYIEFMKFLGY